jgi:hypothetical protein
VRIVDAVEHRLIGRGGDRSRTAELRSAFRHL